MSGNNGHNAGFTLVELLVATTLLALVSAALFGGLRFGARAWESAADRIERDGEIEAVQELLRRTLSEASDLAEAEADSMVGAPDGLSFFAPLPRHAGAGGIGRYRLELDKGGRLLIAWEPRRPGAPLAAPPASEPTIVLADVERISIGYFGAANAKPTFGYGAYGYAGHGLATVAHAPVVHATHVVPQVHHQVHHHQKLIQQVPVPYAVPVVKTVAAPYPVIKETVRKIPTPYEVPVVKEIYRDVVNKVGHLLSLTGNELFH